MISELKNSYERSFTKREDLKKICQGFYNDLYAHKDISEKALTRTLEGLPATFTNIMNESLNKEITENELSQAINSMAKGKAPGHNDISVEFFQKI